VAIPARRKVKELTNEIHQSTDEKASETTMYLRSDVLGEVDNSAASAEPEMWAVDGLPSGVAVLLMKRGPNAGCRFLLDRAAICRPASQ
jgi:hypothetical protein